MKIRNKGEKPSLEMTPMIDVVFQLLIFFIVVLKHDDLYANLDVVRPQPPKERRDIEPITINVGTQGFLFQGRQVPEEQLKAMLVKIARLDSATMIHVTCEAGSPHGSLVKALDACYGAGLRNLSVSSR